METEIKEIETLRELVEASRRDLDEFKNGSATLRAVKSEKPMPYHLRHKASLRGTPRSNL